MENQTASETVNDVSSSYSSRAPSGAMILFILLQCLDLLTTLAAFSRGGVELNPVVRSLMPVAGKVVAVLTSKAILVVLVLLLSRRKQVLYFANFLYTAVVLWNLAIVFALV